MARRMRPPQGQGQCKRAPPCPSSPQGLVLAMGPLPPSTHRPSEPSLEEQSQGQGRGGILPVVEVAGDNRIASPPSSHPPLPPVWGIRCPLPSLLPPPATNSGPSWGGTSRSFISTLYNNKNHNIKSGNVAKETTALQPRAGGRPKGRSKPVGIRSVAGGGSAPAPQPPEPLSQALHHARAPPCPVPVPSPRRPPRCGAGTAAALAQRRPHSSGSTEPPPPRRRGCRRGKIL